MPIQPNNRKMKKLVFLTVIALSFGPLMGCSSEENAENPGVPEEESPEEEGEIEGGEE